MCSYLPYGMQFAENDGVIAYKSLIKSQFLILSPIPLTLTQIVAIKNLPR